MKFGRLGIFAFIPLLIFGALNIVPSVVEAQKPNILVIWGDDIGWYNVGAYNRGMMDYETRPRAKSLSNRPLKGRLAWRERRNK